MPCATCCARMPDSNKPIKEAPRIAGLFRLCGWKRGARRMIRSGKQKTAHKGRPSYYLASPVGQLFTTTSGWRTTTRTTRIAFRSSPFRCSCGPHGACSAFAAAACCNGTALAHRILPGAPARLRVLGRLVNRLIAGLAFSIAPCGGGRLVRCSACHGSPCSRSGSGTSLCRGIMVPGTDPAGSRAGIP